MNFALTDEQVLLREAARGACRRVETVELARAALEGGALPDLWAPAHEAGWTGLLVGEEHGGAGLGAFDAMLSPECGRVLAAVPLLGSCPRRAMPDPGATRPGGVAAGELRAGVGAGPPAGRPRCGLGSRPARGQATRAGAASRARRRGTPRDRRGRWVPDAAGADVLVVVGPARTARPWRSRSMRAAADDRSARRYDATRPLGHVARRRLRARRSPPVRTLGARGTSPRRCSPPSRSARSRIPASARSRTRRSATRSGVRSAPTRRSSTG